MATVDPRDTPKTPDTRPPRRVFRNRRLALIGLAAGIPGLGLCALGAWRDPAQALFSYLTAYAYVASLVVGVLAFSMIGRAMGANRDPSAIDTAPFNPTLVAALLIA